MKNATHKLWPLISGTQFADSYIIDYDNLCYDDYNKLIQRFEDIPNKNDTIIIDKTCEHLHDFSNDIMLLNQLLEKYNCKDRSLVLDNTFDEYFFKQHDIKHISAPFYLFYNIANNNIKIPQWCPQVDYLFVCLNNNHKPHRQKFVEQCQIYGILEKTKWSYRSAIQSNFISTPKFLDQKKGQPGDDRNHEQLYSRATGDNENLEQLYNNVLVSLITETDFYSSNVTHVTEKSLWSIFYGCIPIIVGVPGSVQLLKSWGIDVYDDIIDSSYDNILDNELRLQSVIKQCINLLSEKHPENIKNLLPARVLRNQLLLSNKDYWTNQIKRTLWDYKY